LGYLPTVVTMRMTSGILGLFLTGVVPGQGTVGETATKRPETPVSGAAHAGLRALDEFMLGFMHRHDIPGGALAVSYKGRLVYDRGFGYADVEQKTPARPTSLFRIASISKPFTAVAVLQLVEQGKLSLDDKVFDLLDPKPFGERSVEPRFKKVTILHLLQHRGGWNRVSEFDPMFRSHVIAEEAGHEGPAKPWDIIRYMAARKLQFEPGDYYSYSNFGYCLLGRVIERVSKTGYAEFVKESVLKPVGIRHMRIGATLAKGRLPDEVRYYGQDRRKARSVFASSKARSVPWEYGGFYLEAMDSHGAWLARASDLLRFACDFDDPEKSKLLKPASIEQMFARPPGYAGSTKDGRPRTAFYACGWSIARGTQDHGGSLPGTTTKLMRRSDGIHWAVLLNSRRDAKGKRIHPDHVQGELQRLIARITKWPDRDLFH
jgi:N-acyl-D-amino-acid deacylase